MSYAKVTLEIPQLVGALADVAPIDCQPAKQDELLASGVVVQLETGARVWVACVVQDNPETLPVEFVCTAIAVNADGSILTRPSGQPVSVGYMHPVGADLVADRGMDAIRRDLMLTALGEQPIGDIAPMSAERNIRSYLAVVDQFAAAPTDVL